MLQNGQLTQQPVDADAVYLQFMADADALMPRRGRHTCIHNCPQLRIPSSPQISWWRWCAAKMHACNMHPCARCRLTHHITRFALLNIFCCKQLNFSWTTANLWKGVETLDKCNSYSLKIPLKPKLCDEEKVKQAWNVFGFKMENLNWHSFEHDSVLKWFIFMPSKNFHGYESDSLHILCLLLRRQFLMKYGDVLNILKAK